MKAPYHLPVATRHSLSVSKATSTRLSAIRTSCRASWQSSSSSLQCFHWDRLYSGMSVEIWETVTVRMVAASVADSWVGAAVADSVEDAGVGVTVAAVNAGVL